MRVAIAQFTANLDPGVNREEIRKLTADAASGGAELVVFPEAAARDFGAPGEPLAPVAEQLDARPQHRDRGWARRRPARRLPQAAPVRRLRLPRVLHHPAGRRPDAAVPARWLPVRRAHLL